MIFEVKLDKLESRVFVLETGTDKLNKRDRYSKKRI